MDPDEVPMVQMFKPSELLQFAGYMTPHYRQLIEDQIKRGNMAPDRAEVCWKALKARVIDINEVIFDGAEPKFGLRAK